VSLGRLEGKVPLTTVFEAMTVLAFLLAAVYYFIEISTGIKSMGSFVFPLIFLFQIVSTFGVNVIEENNAVFNTPLFGIHVFTSMIGYSAFVFSMILGVMYIYLFREIKGKKLRFIFDRLPPLESLEKMNIRSVILGFIFLTVGIISGVIWARSAWLELSFFDPKIFISWVMWLIYFVSIVCRFIFSWSGRKLGYMSVFGFIVMIFTFVFVNLIFPTIHEF
jgi:ABC-type transport system involved in cytochrome c biogenesis permease subunit